MVNTILTDILKTFSREDLKKFEDFIVSPYFNKKNTVIKLWDNIKQYYPDFENKNLNRKIVWEKLYPGKDFNYGVMKNLIYDLNQLVEKFLEVEMFADNTFDRGLQLFYSLSDRDLGKLSFSKYKSLEEKLMNSKRGADRYSKLIILKWSMETASGHTDMKINSGVYDISEYMIYDFLISAFKIYNNIAAEKLSNKESRTYDLLGDLLGNTDIDRILESIKKNSPEDHKVVSVFYDMYKALSEINRPESFFNFKNSVMENDHLLDESERKNLFACLWTALSYNKCVKNKPMEFNELMKIQHSKNILLDQAGLITSRKYSLGIRIAAMAKDFDFLKEFSDSYLKCTRPSARLNMTLYGNAYLHFAKGEFGKALETVNKINFDIIAFKYEMKNLQIMLFYELNEIESLMYALDSYKHFASNNQFVSESSRDIIHRFIGYTNALCKLKEKPEKIKIQMLIEKISNDNLNTKYWLLEKAEELILKVK
jgi:hypothetical protein